MSIRIYEAKLTFHLVEEGRKKALDAPPLIVEYLRGAFDEDPTVEWFIVILLNRKNVPLGRCVVSRGSATGTLVHPREVFRSAILANACAIICAHNHPSGDPDPSRNDIIITRTLRDASRIIGIDLLDHIIVGTEPAYYSFAEAGIL